MSLQLIPMDRETGEVLEFRPSMIKELDNSDLTAFLEAVKAADKMKKEAEKEVKKRLDEGQNFTRLSYGKQQFTREIVMDNTAKTALIRKYGLESVEPLSVAKLEKKYGEVIYKDIEQFIIQKPKKPAIKWDE
ncbi:DUF2800 domain-containing protein [Lactococcus petauri]|uniref:DUF2800 domain-containing protein n=1 Tax=Lactococcus petauri TaxID=1940789 RepID=UPI00254BD8DF|nr:DUF2800 domain-containing protein [Lactococcus petauri]MDT2620410.1 DUF2800 domain-containing protein [Lactococcus petauri]